MYKRQEYDLNENLVKLTDRNRKVTTYKHDALNRVTEVTRSNGTKTEVSYDAEAVSYTHLDVYKRQDLRQY